MRILIIDFTIFHKHCHFLLSLEIGDVGAPGEKAGMDFTDRHLDMTPDHPILAGWPWASYFTASSPFPIYELEIAEST